MRVDHRLSAHPSALGANGEPQGDLAGERDLLVRFTELLLRPAQNIPPCAVPLRDRVADDLGRILHDLLGLERRLKPDQGLRCDTLD